MFIIKDVVKQVDFGGHVESITISRVELPKQYNVYDLLDNLIGVVDSLEEGRKLFKERYKYWEGEIDLFIDSSIIPLRNPIEPIKSLSYTDYLIK